MPESLTATSLSAESQALLDAAVDAVILINHQGVVDAFNLAAVRLFGYSAEEMMGRNVTTLMTDREAAAHDAHLARYLSTGQAHIIGTGREVSARRKDGTVFPALLSVGRISDTDPPRFVGFLQDRTSQHRAMAAMTEGREREFRNRERLMHVSRLATMGEISSGIAHELNQPLAAIANFAQAGSRLLMSPKPDMAEVRGALDQITEQALRSGKIVHHLRKLVGTRDSGRELTDINELIEEIQTLTRADARQQNVRVQMQLALNLPRMMLNRVQLQQVLLNLFRNSVDALAGLTSEPKQLLIDSALNSDGDVTVTVSDNGVGVAADILPTLFTPFSTNKPHGSGLGLAISRTIVEAHRGRLEYAANTPRGARFRVILPQ